MPKPILFRAHHRLWLDADNDGLDLQPYDGREAEPCACGCATEEHCCLYADDIACVSCTAEWVREAAQVELKDPDSYVALLRILLEHSIGDANA